MLFIYSFCAARYQMTHGPVPVRGPGVGDLWRMWLVPFLWKRKELLFTQTQKFKADLEVIINLFLVKVALFRTSWANLVFEAQRVYVSLMPICVSLNAEGCSFE